MTDEPSADAPEFTKEDLKRALKAFKKRLKLARRDDESTIGGAFSGGKTSKIAGVRPPDGHPEGIWKALELKGRLKRVPGSKDIYELPPAP